MHFTGIWIVTYITFQCYSLFSKFGVFKIGIIISSSKISWAVPFNTWTKNFMKLLQGHKNMNGMCVIYIMWHTWWGRWRKFRMTFTVFFFFQSGQKSNYKALISIKMLLFLKTIMASCANIPATRVSSSLWQWRLSGLSVFTLKTLRHHANLQI